MTRQRPTLLAAAAAAALVLAARPSPAVADGITPSGVSTANYELTASTPIPAADGQVYPNALQAIFSVSPQGSIVPPAPSASDPTGTPVTLLGSSVGASTDPKQLVAGIKDVTDPNTNATKELFGLSLFGKGLAAGGHVDIALDVNPKQPLPTFAVDPTSAFQNVHLQLITPPTVATTPAVTTTPALPTPPPPSAPATTPAATTTTTAPVTPAANPVFTPEPVSLALWSALAGAGLLRARAFRRRPA